MLGKHKSWKLDPIAQTTEKYLSIRAKFLVEQYFDHKANKMRDGTMEIVFLDSLQFMPQSLASLVSNLTVDQCVNTRGLRASLD